MMFLASMTSSALTPTPSPDAGTSAAVAALSPSSAGTTPAPRRETIWRLRERADALRLELDAVVEGTEEAAAELYAAARTDETQCAKLRELEQELRDKDGRVKMLAAIVDTILTKRK